MRRNATIQGGRTEEKKKKKEEKDDPSLFESRTLFLFLVVGCLWGEWETLQQPQSSACCSIFSLYIPAHDGLIL